MKPLLEDVIKELTMFLTLKSRWGQEDREKEEQEEKEPELRMSEEGL